MESTINLNERIQSNLDFESLAISEKYSIYRTVYDGEFSKEAFLKRVEENRSLSYRGNAKENHSLELNIECPEFKSLDTFFLSSLKRIHSQVSNRISKFSWVYTQTKDFTEHWMHDHKCLHRFNKSNLTTQWVCVFYIQIPFKIEKKEGDLLFKDENGIFSKFTPKEREVIIFSGDLQHMTTPNQHSDIDRISYVSNFNFIKIW